MKIKLEDDEKICYCVKTHYKSKNYEKQKYTEFVAYRFKSSMYNNYIYSYIVRTSEYKYRYGQMYNFYYYHSYTVEQFKRYFISDTSEIRKLKLERINKKAFK